MAKKKDLPPEDKKPVHDTSKLPERILFDRFWSVMLKNQEETDRQLEESERKFDRQMEERTRYLRESNSKFNRQWEEKNRQLNESEHNILSKFDKNRQIYRQETHGIGLHGTGGYGPGGFGHGSGPGGGYGDGKGLTNKLGRMMGVKKEQANSLELSKQFEEFNLRFDDVSPGGRRILDLYGNIKMEIGTVMENPDCIMVVELIPKPDKDAIDEFASKLLMLRDHRDKYHDRRKIHGAVIGKSFKEADKKTVLEAGFFVIEQGGGAMRISAPESMPREF